MPEHISLFCRSKRFNQCHQYAVGCEETRGAIERFVNHDKNNRRKFFRVPDEVDVLVEVLSDSGQTIEQIGATTLDISLWGMRLKTVEKLIPHTKVFFAFGQEFTVPNWRGQGQIRWTKPNDVGSCYEIGMNITDNDSYHAIGQHIGMSGYHSTS